MKPTTTELYHLHSRAEFFVHHTEISEEPSIEKAVEAMFSKQKSKDIEFELPAFDPQRNKSLSQKKKMEMRKLWREQVGEINRLWCLQMMETDKSLTEKMTLFWHGHFACRTVENPYTTLHLNKLLRKNALGSFKEMLLDVAKSPGMIGYLHLRQNKKNHPNEDFARELCELFTLGRDVDYTEKDVEEIARAFTGWTTDSNGNWIIKSKQHDETSKTIFGRSGNFDGEDVLNMILENKHCADHIAKKVYQFFVQEEVNEKHVSELSEVFYDSDYDIAKMMKYLFKANWFYEAQGRIIKSPIELMVVLGKMFNLKYPDLKSAGGVQHYLGQVLFDPPNVAGWPGGRQWIDASRMALRLRLGSLIINKGLIVAEMTPELDEMINRNNKKKRKDLKFYEEVDWDAFWVKNEGADLFDLLIRSKNESLKANHNTHEVITVIQLLSTPDFQLT